jgi:hypothetical protein
VASDPFKQAMARLKRAAPREFEDFLNQFELYSNAVTVAVTDAPADNVLVAQGMARQCRGLLRALAECEAPPQRPVTR